jgi:hypothetical protein
MKKIIPCCNREVVEGKEEEGEKHSNYSRTLTARGIKGKKTSLTF